MLKKSVDFYLQILMFFGLLLLMALFISTRIFSFKILSFNLKSEGSSPLFRNDAYQIEIDLAQKKNELALYQSELAQKYSGYREELVKIKNSDLSELEKKQKEQILQNSYSADIFENLKNQINQTLKDIQKLEGSRCTLACLAS